VEGVAKCEQSSEKGAGEVMGVTREFVWRTAQTEACKPDGGWQRTPFPTDDEEIVGDEEALRATVARLTEERPPKPEGDGWRLVWVRDCEPDSDTDVEPL
jgi:hypothetical protein